MIVRWQFQVREQRQRLRRNGPAAVFREDKKSPGTLRGFF
jgi:hypothetical protein